MPCSISDVVTAHILMSLLNSSLPQIQNIKNENFIKPQSVCANCKCSLSTQFKRKKRLAIKILNLKLYFINYLNNYPSHYIYQQHLPSMHVYVDEWD